MSFDFGKTAVFPSSGGVRFLGRRCTGQASGTAVPQFYTKIVAFPSAGVPNAPASIQGVQSTIKWFHDSAIALFNQGSSTPTNQADLDALANRILKDYWGWLTESFDEVYPEVIAPVPNALLDTIEWTYRPRGELFTRLFTKEYNSDPEELFHWYPTSGCVDVSSANLVVGPEPCIIFYGPPAQCSGVNLTMTRYKVCLTDGLLIQTYISTDVVQ
jgi:hypothetical protein